MLIEHVEIYTTATCMYCKKAKLLLKELNINNVKVLTLGIGGVTKETLQEHMDSKFPSYGKVKTVPQIFINGNHIGGYTELAKLVEDGQIQKQE